VALGIGDDFAVGRMVGRLDGDDSLGDLGRMRADVIGKLRLGAGRADDQDFAGIGERLGDLGIKPFLGRGVTAAHRAGLVMNVPCRQMRMQRGFVRAAETDMEDLRLRMVDPNHGVKMSWHMSWPCLKGWPPGAA